ncbi:rod shape determining protein RodA [Catalinimonas alkaloidigena]|uniref:Cell wall polymerase n=2 Tax=Catalinimonas alkaloidigena TaxID=1075417 RepID=A0A1G9N009_9BACT|nr:rod shape determining protein RodA [Catalinimonas alkaloidigena]
MVLLYAALVLIGWSNIFAVTYDPQADQSIFDMELNSGRQMIWIICSSILLILPIMVIDFRFYESFSYVIYAVFLLVLLSPFVLGSEINGSKSWVKLGALQIQPAEFAKFATALCLARYLDRPQVKLNQLKEQLVVAGIIGLPAIIIILQNETGSTLVFSAFIVALYREGLPSWIPVLGLIAVALFVLTLFVPQMYLLIAFSILAVVAFAYVMFNERTVMRKVRMTGLIVGALALMAGEVSGVNFFINNILQPHQQVRIKALINPEYDPSGFGYQVIQSKIAIGSGGLSGKGFLQGTQTKFDFVPEQSTDFIFCTIGEEHGWTGSVFIISLFVALLARIIYRAEQQRTPFTRVYGYCVAGILFFHFTVNIGMTIGLFPVIGIPLPFFSYGGSSLWSFTILLFIFIKLDAHRSQVIGRTLYT